MICLALRPRLSRTSPSLTRVNHRSNVPPGPPASDFRFEMINRFLLSGDQIGLKSAAGVEAISRAPDPSAFITKTSSLPSDVPFDTVRRKAIWVPSGDHAGSASTPSGDLVNCFGAPVPMIGSVYSAPPSTFGAVACPVEDGLSVRRESRISDIAVARLQAADQSPVHPDEEQADLVLADPAADEYCVRVGQAP